MIEGEKVKEKKKEEMGYYRSEFSYGHFYRTISLPAEVDQDKVEATYENGVLNISLNKLTEGKQTTKKIEIKH
jgi:HSP20 family protein